MHQGYLRLLKQRGGMLVCGQRIDALDHQGGLWTARALETSFQARVIINAAGAWADHVAALAGVRPLGLVPKRRTAIIVDGLSGIDTRTMPTVDFTATDAYFKPDGSRIMASLGDQDPVEAQDIRPDEWEIALLADWLQRETQLSVKRIGHSWAGLRTFVSDASPVVGFDDGVPNFFWLAAQGGYGIMMAPALGQAAATLARHHDLPDELTTQGVDAADLCRSREAKPATALPGQAI
ncbi:MAG: FAD-binding oxidoreductase [Methylococcus sp.]|nr:MAG: FAD-binding oxidoreductase [Methylococcus sp.]